MATDNKWIAVGAVFLALGVACGAFGAHALKGYLDEYSSSVYQKAVLYHLVHALGLLIVGTIASLPPAVRTTVACLLSAGIIFFSGSLYALALTGYGWLGAVTPIGGVAFIAAWLWLACSALRSNAAQL